MWMHSEQPEAGPPLSQWGKQWRRIGITGVELCIVIDNMTVEHYFF